MAISFSPASFDLTAPINSHSPALHDLTNPIPINSFLAGVRFDAAPENATVRASIESESGIFEVADLTVFDVALEFVDDPDLDQHHGHRAKQKVLELSSSVVGNRPIQLISGQVLLVRTVYNAGPAATTHTGVLTISGMTPSPIKIPLSLSTFVPAVSVVEMSPASSVVSIVAGSQATLSVLMRLVSGPAVDIHFEKAQILFDAQVELTPTVTHVLGGEVATATLKFVAPTNANPGSFDFAIRRFPSSGELQFLPEGALFLAIRINVIPAPTEEFLLREADRQISEYWSLTNGVFRVGYPNGDAVRMPDGRFAKPYGLGKIIVPKDWRMHPLDGTPLPPGTPPPPEEKIFVITDINIVGMRCFGTNDPGNGDELYLVSTISWTDPTHGSKTFTKLIDISDQHVVSGQVVLKGVSLLDQGVLVRGSIGLTVNIQVWDRESGNPEDVKRKISEVAQQATAAAGVIATAFLAKPVYVAISAVIAAIAKLSGILGPIGDGIAGLISGMFDDDHLGSMEETMTGYSADLADPAFLQRLVDNPVGLDRKSPGSLLSQDTYNFPQKIEDDSPIGRSWLISDSAQYRIFLKVTGGVEK